MSATRPVAFFLPSLGGGGAERNVARLAGALAARGHEVHLVVGNPDGPVADEVAESVHVVGLGVSRMGRAIGPLAAYLARERPRVLVAAHEHANVVAVVARWRSGVRIPLVLTLRSTLSVQAREANDWRDRWLIPSLTRLLYPRVDRLIALSHAAAEDAERCLGLAPGAVTVIGNPIVSDRLAASAALPVAHPAFEPGQPPVILAVGRLVPEKGHLLLFDAMSRLMAVGVPAQLVVMGDGPLRNALEAEARRRELDDRVVFVGYQANPLPWMSRAAVVVLASRYEGLPTVLVEALACGARVVATDAPGGTREVLGGGQWGSLVPLDDPGAMADALASALAAGRPPSLPSEALEPYTEAHVVQAYQRLLAGLEATAQ